MAESHWPENAEASIIGCLLLCPDTRPAVSRLVNEGDFSPGLNAALFAAALELEEPDSAAFHAAGIYPAGRLFPGAWRHRDITG